MTNHHDNHQRHDCHNCFFGADCPYQGPGTLRTIGCAVRRYSECTPARLLIMSLSIGLLWAFLWVFRLRG